MDMVHNTHVYGISTSVYASGLPMKVQYNQEDTALWTESAGRRDITREGVAEENNKDLERAIRLAANPPGTGHNNFLKGIIVQEDITASIKWWQQAQRYNWFDIVSSMSTMHKLREMLINRTAQFAHGTSADIINILYSMVDKEATDEELAVSCPAGLLITAAVSTNYLQLKTIYHQRKNHKLTEWREYCRHIETLPLATKLIITNRKDV